MPAHRFGRSLVAWSLAALCWTAVLTASRHHPAPAAWIALALLALAGVTWRVALQPGLALLLLPAALPVASWSHWTGWRPVDEFDLLVLAVAAGLALCRAGVPRRPHPTSIAEHATPATTRGSTWPEAVWLGLLVIAGLAAVRGVFEASASDQAFWWQGEREPAQALGALKALLEVTLLACVMSSVLAGQPSALRRRLPWMAGRGLALGLLLVGAVTLFERARYPGWLDFSTDYRSTAWFWEMRVGGASLDAYLMLTFPAAVCLYLRARRRTDRILGWLALLLGWYACITSFSRAIYLALPVMGVGLLWLAWRWRQVHRGRFRPGAPARRPGRSWVLDLGLLIPGGVLVWMMLFAGDYMRERIEESPRSWQVRWQHLSTLVGWLDTPLDWGFGLGAGQMANLSARLGGEALAAGDWRWIAATPDARATAPGGYLRLTAADRRDRDGRSTRSGERLRVTQWLDPLVAPASRALELRLQVRRSPGWPAVTTLGEAEFLQVEICQKHLLYARGCRVQRVLLPANSDWTALRLAWPAGTLTDESALARPAQVLTLAVDGRAASVDVDAIELRAGAGPNLVANGDFDAGLARWTATSDRWHLPWHAQNLAVHVLLEQGVIGLALLALALACALRPIRQGRFAFWMNPLWTGMAGLMVIGLIDSVLEAPRIATLFWGVMWACLAGRVRSKADPL